MFKAIVGDRGRPFFAVLVTGDGTPVDLASSTCTFTMKNSAGTSEVAAQSCTVHPTQTFTASATTDFVTANDHKVQHGDQVIVSSTTTLPTGLSAATRYFARDVDKNVFRLAETSGGPAIDITGTGSGTHSFYIVGSVQYSWAAADVDTAETYGGFIQETVGGLIRTYPVDVDGIHRGFPIVISAL